MATISERRRRWRRDADYKDAYDALPCSALRSDCEGACSHP